MVFPGLPRVFFLDCGRHSSAYSAIRGAIVQKTCTRSRDAMSSSPTRANSPASLRTAGTVLMAAAILEVLVMGHHPSVRVRDPAQGVAALQAVGTISAWVHGILIALLIAGLN